MSAWKKLSLFVCEKETGQVGGGVGGLQASVYIWKKIRLSFMRCEKYLNPDQGVSSEVYCKFGNSWIFLTSTIISRFEINRGLFLSLYSPYVLFFPAFFPYSVPTSWTIITSLPYFRYAYNALCLCLSFSSVIILYTFSTTSILISYHVQMSNDDMFICNMLFCLAFYTLLL